MNTVGDLKDSIAGILSGLNLESVTNLNKALERAVRRLLRQADIPEATQRLALTLYDGVFDYSLGSADIFGSALIDLRPQAIDRDEIEDVRKRGVVRFDRTKNYNVESGYTVAFEYREGTPIMRVISPRPNQRSILDSLKETTGWVAAGTASGLQRDETIFYESPSSVRFNLAGAGTGTLTKTRSSALSISRYEDVAVAFLALRIPSDVDPEILTSAALRIGSDDSNYDEVSVTQGFLGAWLAGEFLLIAFDMAQSTSTGTPDWSAIDYMQIRLAHSAGLTSMHVGGLWLSLPSPHLLIYQTAAVFLQNNTLSKKITNDEDQIILNDDAYTLLEHEGALVIAQQSGSGRRGKVQELEKTLHGDRTAGKEQLGLYQLYRADNPSQEIREVDFWHEEFGY